MSRPWIASMVAALLAPGPAFAQPCTQPPATNCQVFSTLGAFNSTGGNRFVSADDFTPVTGGSVTAICFWGAYVPDPAADPPADDFTVRYYQDNGFGFPGALVAEHTQASGALAVTGPVDTGETTGGGAARIWEYSATHPAVAVSAGQCYWLEISNPNDGTGATEWFWSWALDGEGNAWSMVDGAPPDGYGFADVRDSTDLAFCLSLALGDPADPCGPPPECGPGAGPCDEPNGTVGCEDPGCCALVCADLPFCCTVQWFQSCVDAADEQGCLVSLPEPCQPPLNCHVADLQGHGGLAGDAFVGGGADVAAGFVTADNFTPATSGAINALCWWGFYFDFDAGVDCSPGPGDTFTVTYYQDDGTGLPGAVIASHAVTPSVTEDGGLFAGALPVFRFDATHPDVTVTAGTCYWIEIANNLDGTCVWFWSTAPPGDGYAAQDQGDGWDPADGENWDTAWCINLPLADEAPCAPPTPMEVCPADELELSQSTDPDTITPDSSAVCVSGGDPDLFGRESGYARSYDLSANPDTAGSNLAVSCVQFGVELNQGGAYTVNVNIYDDTDGGPPTRPGADLVLLGSADALVPATAALGFVTATFEPPVEVAADSVMVVELYLPDRNPAGGGDKGGMSPGSNALGATGPTYLRAPDCSFDDFVDVADAGFPDMHLVQRVAARPSGEPCPGDCQTTPDGEVNIPDFLALLAQWGQVGTSCDFDGGGVSVTDFLDLLAWFGPCP